MLKLLTLLLFCGSASAETLQSVAVHALKEAFNRPNGQQWEHGGIVFLRNGQMIHTSPAITDSQSDSLWIVPRNLKGPSDVLLAMYHTHPCLPDSHFPQYFSVPDIAISLFERVPTFVLDECSGMVHEFDPTVDDPNKTEETVTGGHHVVIGRIIGNIGQVGRNVENQ